VLLTEGRLLALCFPELVEPLLRAAAEDPTKEAMDRYYAIQLLGVLAYAGRRDAQDDLLRLSNAKDPGISGPAIKQLYPVDPNGMYRGVYEAKCSEENVDAFEALAHWPDSGTRSLMEGLRKADPERSSLPFLAERTLKNYEILDANNANARLEAIIKDPHGANFELTNWAIEVAKARGMPSLKSALRDRLVAGLDDAYNDSRQLAARVRSYQGDDRAFQNQYATESCERILKDVYHDDVLIALSEQGGTLTADEQTRLKTFGYFGDLQERLAELMVHVPRAEIFA
jgi:hypothetical protein